MDIYRGDVFYVCKGSEIGSEQYGGRPAVIVSNNIGNAHSNDVTVVYLTTKEKTPLPTHTEVTTVRAVSTALCEGVTTISKERLRDFMCSLTNEEMEKIDQCIRIALDLGIDPLPFTPEEPEETPFSRSDEEYIRLQAERDVYKELYMKAAGLI